MNWMSETTCERACEETRSRVWFEDCRNWVQSELGFWVTFVLGRGVLVACVLFEFVVGPSRLADEVKQWKQKMAKWKGKVAERLQILEKRARGEGFDMVHDHLECFLCDFLQFWLSRSLRS